jgi:UDP-2,3-diacylglucosamine hydrolase
LDARDHRKKVYFISDCHFGIPDRKSSLERERLFIEWLEMVEKDALEIYLMGDLFDFWFEYKTVIPKGYSRLMGKLAHVIDQGIPIHYFLGNHDIWAFSYLRDEIGMQLNREPVIKSVLNHQLYLAHGDGLGKGDNGYKFLKKVFEFPLNQWLFRWLHPDIGARFGLYWSRKSRYANNRDKYKVEGMEKGVERLSDFSKEILQNHPQIDYFIFGHIHLQRNIKLSAGSSMITLGDWLSLFTYASLDEDGMKLHAFESKKT